MDLESEIKNKQTVSLSSVPTHVSGESLAHPKQRSIYNVAPYRYHTKNLEIAMHGLFGHNQMFIRCNCRFFSFLYSFLIYLFIIYLLFIYLFIYLLFIYLCIYLFIYLFLYFITIYSLLSFFKFFYLFLSFFPLID